MGPQNSASVDHQHQPACFTALVTGERWLGNIAIAILALQTIVLAQHTFAWRYGEDVGFFYYFSWLVNEHGYLPYRDLHETSFPGSFLLYSLLTRIGGYSVIAYNITHMLLFGALSTAGYCWLRQIDRRMALAAICLFGSVYFFMHRSMHMQRDFMVLLFVLPALAVMTGRWRLSRRAAVCGVLFGLAAAIKPHAALAAPLAVILGTISQMPDATLHNPRQLFTHCLRAALISAGAFAGVWLLFAGWLIHSGAWPYFFRMFTEYLPLYQKMNGIHVALPDTQRWQNAADWLRGSLTVGTLPVTAGAVFCYCNPALSTRQKLQVLLLVLLWPVYLVYVALGGKFWDYHQIPLYFFFNAALCLAFIPFAVRSWIAFWFRMSFVVIMALLIQFSISPRYALAVACLTGNPVCDTEEQATYATEDRLEQFLRDNVKPGERVEPYATSTLGPLFPAMLRAGIEPATPYVEGFPLYHDADTAYVEHIRADMLQRLQAAPPPFIIRPVNFFAPGGPTASPFTALDNFIREHYDIIDSDLPVTIFRRKNP